MRMQQAIGLSLALLVGSTAAMAKEAQSGRDQPAPSIKAKPAKVETASDKPSSKRHRAHGKVIVRSGSPARQEAGQLPPPDRYIGPVQVIGRREIGSAAWYGGYHLGRRTASGERLDAVHPTAAHRSLPLHSLVRVTNLRNGRSIIATINDRGPVSRSLLIDVSPCVADELEMRGAGIATVAVEPVARAAPASQAARP